jgi:hypothetical protein
MTITLSLAAGPDEIDGFIAAVGAFLGDHASLLAR